MPFIDSKFTVPVSEEKKETIKSELGRLVSLINKPESFLMVGIEDNYTLYMGGDRLEKGAFVSVSMYGNASPDAYDQMTAEICSLYERELEIPANKVYVTYQGIKDWGWNGRNF